jgi:hypothetical protein
VNAGLQIANRYCQAGGAAQTTSFLLMGVTDMHDMWLLKAAIGVQLPLVLH